MPTDLDWSMLVPLREAAQLLGVSEGHLRRQCGVSLADRSLAVFAKPPTGGKAQWFIDRRYDLKLAPGIAGARQQVHDLSHYTQSQQHAAWQRAACVESFREARSNNTGDERSWLEPLIYDLRDKYTGLRISRSSLFRWHKAYRNPSDIIKLIDDRGGNTRGKGDPAAWKAFKDLYLDDRQPSLKTCWQRVKQMASHHGWLWCSYKGCQRQLPHRIPPELQARYRDPKRWRTQMQPTIAQDTEAWSAGQCWVGDHKQMDIWCRVGKRLIRPWLTTWMDWRTRRIAGWCMSPNPNSSTILAALRQGLTDDRNMGGPSVVWIDNGKDYDCYAFHGQTKQQRLSKTKIEADEAQAQGLFQLLGIEVHFSLAYNPNGKARMERWFRSIEDLGKSFSSYAGRSTETKPESLKRILANPRLVPMFDHVKDRLAQYIKGNNARTDHAIEDLSEDGVAISPDQAMSRWCRTHHVMADPSVLDLLLQTWHKPVTVGRNGITVNIAGKSLSYGQFDPALTPFKARLAKDRPALLVSYNPHQIGSIRVYDDRYRYIAEVSLNGIGGRHGQDAVSRDHVTKLIRNKREYDKSLKFIKEHRELEYLTDAEILADSALPDDLGPDPDRGVPGAMKIIQTPIDGQSKAVERDQLRQAAGAEYDETPIELDLRPPMREDDDLDGDPIEFTTEDPSATFADMDDLDMDVDLELSLANQEDGDDHLLDQML